MSFLLETANDGMRRSFPELPWSIRMSYNGQSRSFGSGPERAALEFKTAGPLAWLTLGNIPAFLDGYVRGDDRGRLLPGLSPSQWVSMAAFVAVAGALRKRGLRVFDPALEGPYLDGKP